MKLRLITFCAHLAAFVLSVATFPAFAQTNLPPKLEASLKKSGLAPAAMSVVVMPANLGAPVLSHQAEKAVSAASTMKLVSTFIALDQLGPNFRWKTQILSDIPVKDGVLMGNVYWRGGGDPNLTLDKLSLMLRSLRQQGLREIRGDMVLDRSYFQPARPELGMQAFDDNPDAYYNVVPDALLVHSNITAFALDSTGENVDVKLMTPMDKVQLHNQLKLNDRPCNEWKATWLSPKINVKENAQIDISLSGSFPKRCQVTHYLNIVERNVYIANMLRTLWKELGGTWSGQVLDGKTPDNAILLHERESETLADTLRIINKFSDNAMARILFMTMGVESPQSKSFTESNQAANAVIHTWLIQQGINDAGLVFENGSGLSRIDRISPLQLASILRVAANSNWSPEFASSLPIVAVDGSMRKRLKGSNAEGRARIKTGYLKNVMAIAGYVRDIHQKDWIVVAIINSDQPAASKGKPALDELIDWVANGQTLP